MQRKHLKQFVRGQSEVALMFSQTRISHLNHHHHSTIKRENKDRVVTLYKLNKILT
jgi:hypothetical protein